MSVNNPETNPPPVATAPADAMSTTLDLKSAMTTTPAPAENEFQKSFGAIVPETYKGKEYVQNILKTENPIEELFKQYEHAQSLVGQRTGLQKPGDDATPEQLKEWHKALGVPDDTKDYTPKEITWGDEDKPFAQLVTQNRVEAVTKAVADKAHALGLTPAQFQAITETYDTEMVKHLKTSLGDKVNEQIEKDKAFTERMATMYGDKAPQVLENGKRLIAENVSEELKAEVQKLPPEAVAVLAATLDGISRKYIREDKFNVGGNTGGSNSISNLKQLSEEGRKLMADPAYRDRNNPRHKEVVDKVNSFYENNGRPLLAKQ